MSELYSIFYSIFIQACGWIFIATTIVIIAVWIQYKFKNKADKLSDDNYDKNRILVLPDKFILAINLFTIGISKEDKKVKVLVDLFKTLMEIIYVGIDPKECGKLATEFNYLLNSEEFKNWLDSNYINNYSAYIILSDLNEYLEDYIILVRELSKKFES